MTGDSGLVTTVRRVLVLGATGTVGRDVVAGLVARGVPVTAAARHPDDGPTTGPAGVSPVRFDLADRATWPAALAGADGLFLLRPPQVARVRADLLPFVDAALRAGVRRVAFLSVQGAGRNPVVPHHAVEQHLARSGAAWTSLRAGYFAQNLLTVHRAEIRDRDELAVPAGRGRTAFVDTRDVAEAAAVVLTAPGAEHERRAYELTGPAALTYTEVTATLSEVLGRAIHYVPTTPLEHLRRARAAGDPTGFALVTLALYTTARLGLAAHLSPELAALLGRPPRDLATFARDSAAAWRR